jgi:drug/metabolite transporter (DMT)-like permease
MTKRNASFLILTGGTCMSFVGLLMRLIDNADGYQILMYRSISLSLIVAIIVCLKRKVNLFVFLRSINKIDFYMGTSLAIAFTFYVFAMINTSVASTLLILTATPFFAALLAMVFLGETPARITWICMIGAVLGVGLMVSDGIELGRTTGNVYAIISSISFAIMLVFARKNTQVDPLGGTFMAGIISAVAGLILSYIFGTGIDVSSYDLYLTLFMGAFTIGLGIALVTWGTATVPAAEASLLLLIESLLGPVWVWVFLSEAMTIIEIIGGTFVLLSVVAQALLQSKHA